MIKCAICERAGRIWHAIDLKEMQDHLAAHREEKK